MAQVARPAQVMVGDLAEPDDVRRAVDGADAVFAVPVGGPDEAKKARNGRLLIEAARESGARHFVQTTVAALPAHLGFGDPGTGYSFEPYTRARLEIEETVRAAGFRHWTILQPVAFMENFTGDKARFMYPGMASGRLDSAHHSDARVQYIATRDVAAFAVTALENPERFTHHDIELASQALTMGEIAAVLGEETGRSYTHRTLTPAEAADAGIHAGIVHSHLWDNRIGYHAPLADDQEKQWGIRPLTFRDWARANHQHLSSGQDPR
ncbi:NmrA family NAD(P)-binding protein [Promicromonospora panici]|uniref:NmrA family NAD(P)-binding protein n=1 Tax=Promicromonospora panici TaxID=2219658 RepID=UPI0013ED17E3|nr:NmrA family NAD(P)-binding protein [Promicromonospora panici]